MIWKWNLLRKKRLNLALRSSKMIYTFKEILEMHGSLIDELRKLAPADEKENDAYFLGARVVLFKLFEKGEASKIVQAASYDELIDYVLTPPKKVDMTFFEE